MNIDHVATLRQARAGSYPDPTEVALLAEEAGADFITLHLREDRRHIQERDVLNMQERLTTHMNLEMAITEEMLAIALSIKPQDVCLVPEKRQELTTEGGLDVISQFEQVKRACQKLASCGIRVSLFIDASFEQIDAARSAGVSVVEIHTGHYASAPRDKMQAELDKVLAAIDYGHSIGLTINAGHGLNCGNVLPIAAHPAVSELNIGHSIIARSVYVGIEQAVREIKDRLWTARENS